MKHPPLATAHAVAATTAIVFVACRLLVGIVPDFMFAVGQSWFHGIGLTRMSSWNLSSSSFILGLVSVTSFAWLVGYLFATLYNSFLKK